MNQTSPKTREGFTLLELLVVIAIIGVLSSVVLASLNAARAKARDTQRVSDIQQISKALEMYFNDNGRYPPIQHALGYDTSSTTIAGCGHVNRWCTLETMLELYISSIPREPLGDTPQYHYFYNSSADDGYKTYGLYAILEVDQKIAQNDGGYYPSAGSTTVRYEVGPEVRYCMTNYSGMNARWDGGKVSWENVCAGGN